MTNEDVDFETMIVNDMGENNKYEDSYINDTYE